MIPALVAACGAVGLVVAAFLVDFRLGLAVFSCFLLAVGLFVDFEGGS